MRIVCMYHGIATNTLQLKISWCVWIISVYKNLTAFKNENCSPKLTISITSIIFLTCFGPLLYGGPTRTGKTNLQIAELCELSRKAVDTWARAYESEAAPEYDHWEFNGERGWCIGNLKRWRGGKGLHLLETLKQHDDDDDDDDESYLPPNPPFLALWRVVCGRIKLSTCRTELRFTEPGQRRSLCGTIRHRSFLVDES